MTENVIKENISKILRATNIALYAQSKCIGNIVADRT